MPPCNWKTSFQRFSFVKCQKKCCQFWCQNVLHRGAMWCPKIRWTSWHSDGAVFEMFLRDPFKVCWCPPTRGSKGHFESPFVSVFRLLSAWKSGKKCAKYGPHPAVCSRQIIFIAWIQFGKSLRNQAYFCWIHPHHLEWGTCASSPSWLFNKEEARSQRTPPVQYIITVLPGKEYFHGESRYGPWVNYSEKEQASQDSSCRLKSSEVWWPVK